MRHFKVIAFVAISAVVLGLNMGIATESRAQTSPQEAARFVADMGSQAAVLLAPGKADQPAKQRTALRTLIRDSFNLELTSQFVLGKFWNNATPEQRTEFQDLFTEYLLNNYVRHIGNYKAETLTIVGSNLVGDRDVLVETNVESIDGSTNPVWRVRVSDAGQYGIIDVSVDGVSLALTQRREFASVVNRRGLDGLLNMLREKLAAQAKAVKWAPRREPSHYSLLASILASPNASKIGILLAVK
ncbi:MAG: MlaC/ttg2D family ABC transporter substrate-binding protein [Alphaproteobacteria bacterium]